MRSHLWLFPLLLAVSMWLGCGANQNPSATQPAGGVGVAGSGDNGGGSDTGSANGGSDQGGGTGGSGGGGSANGSGDNGGGESTECLLAHFDLNGYWVDHGSTDRQVQIQQIGGTIIATYVDPPFFVCDLRDGTGATQTTFDDFSGTLFGCHITGQIKVCHFGCSSSSGGSAPPLKAISSDHRSSLVTNQSSTGTCGIIDVDFVATVDFNNNHIEGTWHNADSNSEVPLSLDREPCRKKRGDDYVPVPSLNWDRTEVDPTEVRYRASAAAGSPGIALTADVTGTVSSVFPAENGQPPQINIDLPDGNALLCAVYGDGSVVLVKPGDSVIPSTPIATLNREASSGSYAFTVGGLVRGTTDTISPDCVEQ